MPNLPFTNRRPLEKRQTLLRHRTLSVVATVTLAVLSLSGGAQAYCRTTTAQKPPSFRGCANAGLPLFWKNACVGISYPTTDGRKLRTEELAAGLSDAFATWTGVTCPGGGHPSIAVKPFASTAASQVAYESDAPNVNLVIMRDDAWAYGAGDVPEITMPTTSFDADTGEILDVDIELNTKDYDFALGDPVAPNSVDLQTVLLRTAGTFLGLASSDDTTSVMFGGFRPGTTRRKLSVDDVAGICEIYPPDGTRKTGGGIVVATACNPYGVDEGTFDGGRSDDGCAAAPKTPATGGMAIAALTALALVGVRRRRRP